MFFPTLLIACEQFVPCAREESLSCGVGCATGGLLLGCKGAAGPGSSPAQGMVRQSTLATATSSWVFNISTDGDPQDLWAICSCVCLLSQELFFFLCLTVIWVFLMLGQLPEECSLLPHSGISTHWPHLPEPSPGWTSQVSQPPPCTSSSPNL